MDFGRYLGQFSWPDWLGLGWFLVCWFGYEQIVEHGWLNRQTLHAKANEARLAWGGVMVRRAQRIVDVGLIGNILQSLSFYANTSIYIIAALFAALGTLDQLMVMTSELPFSKMASKEVAEIKLLILIGVFVAAYFKFTWSLRQFNILSIILGATPQDAPDEELDRHARRFAAVNSCAGNDFNRGLRAYYFGMAVMSWMVSAWLFICSTVVIVFVLARREYSSPLVEALSHNDEPVSS